MFIKGNINKDGKVNISDAVSLQKWLLGTGNLTDWKNADFCKDNRIDVVDMVEMRKFIIQNK
ncbi:MAG: dockerin type I repeat-containing protein [Ruminococcus sp.]|nr:dockerin type I repeat-containing protein [Ruminococcus sp.]MDE7138553.1 dockerin type I repeat-containing protein [Ruminococcus sp.]